MRRRLPDTRPSQTVKVEHGGFDGYVIVGFFEDDTPGEIFIRMSKTGSTVQGLLDMIAVQASYLLQHGDHIAWLTEKWRHHRFDPIINDRSLMDTMADAVLHACSIQGTPSCSSSNENSTKQSA